MALLIVAEAMVVHASRSLGLELFVCTLGCTGRPSSVEAGLEVDGLALGVANGLGIGRGGFDFGLSSPKCSCPR